MKQDYLWDKTGTDPEIVELENALAAFRYRETEPPALPAKILPFPALIAEKTPRRFSLGFSLAACAAAVLITFGVLFQFSGGETAIENDLTQTFSTNKEIQNDLPADAETLTIQNVETSPQIEVSKRIIKQFENTWTNNRTKPIAVKIRQPVSKVSGSNQIFNRNTETENSTVRLTDEEKHAYDQLMLALSITSEKLKIVKDKIDGVEEQTEVLKDGR